MGSIAQADVGVEQLVLREGPAALGRALAAIEDAEREARETARDLFLAGLSWADVGRLCGVTRQAARQRFGPAVEAWRAEHGALMPWEVHAAGAAGVMGEWLVDDEEYVDDE